MELINKDKLIATVVAKAAGLDSLVDRVSAYEPKIDKTQIVRTFTDAKGNVMAVVDTGMKKVKSADKNVKIGVGVACGLVVAGVATACIIGSIQKKRALDKLRYEEDLYEDEKENQFVGE